MSSHDPTHPPGWYPDNSGVTRYWDGRRFTEHTAPSPYSVPTHGAPRESVGIGLAIGGGAVLVGLVGLVLAFQSASLLTGTGTQWTGLAIAALAAIGSVIASAVLWKRIHLGLALANVIVPALIALLALANVVYLEVQLEERREDLRSTFGD